MGAGDAAYGWQRGWWDCTVRAKSDIYDCLVYSAKRHYTPTNQPINGAFEALNILLLIVYVVGR